MRGDAGRRGGNGPQKSSGFSRFLGFSSFSWFLFIFRINSNAIHSRYTPIFGHTHMVVWFCVVFLVWDMAKIMTVFGVGEFTTGI